MNKMVNKNKDKNNSSNSLVLGRWPQTKMHFSTKNLNFFRRSEML